MHEDEDSEVEWSVPEATPLRIDQWLHPPMALVGLAALDIFLSTEHALPESVC